MTTSIIPRSKATLNKHYTPFMRYPVKNIYFLTIQKPQKLHHVLPSEILQVLAILKNKIQIKITDHSFETSGRYEQLHLHAIVTTNTFFKFKDFYILNGFHLQWKTINNLRGMLNYIYKDTQGCRIIQSQIIADNLYMHKQAPNMFL